ncbi:MAG: hypothetical protein ACJ77Z_19455, partial [Thermoleophilaceae bacterium]
MRDIDTARPSRARQASRAPFGCPTSEPRAFKRATHRTRATRRTRQIASHPGARHTLRAPSGARHRSFMNNQSFADLGVLPVLTKALAKRGI